MLSMTSASILSECAKIERKDLIKPLNESAGKDMIYQLSNLDVVDEEVLGYTEEMVNVHQDSRQRYLIEFDNLVKFMRSNEYGPKQALNKVCEHYNISVADTYIVMESAEHIMNEFKQLQLCSESSNPKVKKWGREQLSGMNEEFNSMIDEGIKMMVKPSNGATCIY